MQCQYLELGHDSAHPELQFQVAGHVIWIRKRCPLPRRLLRLLYITEKHDDYENIIRKDTKALFQGTAKAVAEKNRGKPQSERPISWTCRITSADRYYETSGPWCEQVKNNPK